VAALLGAYASSLISAGLFQLSNVETVGSFTIRASRVMIWGGPPSMLLSIAVAADGETPIAFANQCKVEIMDMNLTKVEDTRILEILADRVSGEIVIMNMTSLMAENATFNDLTMVDIPKFEQRVEGSVTMYNVEIHAVYMFAKLQTIYGMKLNIKESD
jgi:hypothetical protein